jgi:hypothetical protein
METPKEPPIRQRLRELKNSTMNDLKDLEVGNMSLDSSASNADEAYIQLHAEGRDDLVKAMARELLRTKKTTQMNIKLNKLTMADLKAQAGEIGYANKWIWHKDEEEQGKVFSIKPFPRDWNTDKKYRVVDDWIQYFGKKSTWKVNTRYLQICTMTQLRSIVLTLTRPMRSSNMSI